MKIKLLYKFWQVRRLLAPSSQFKSALKKRLLTKTTPIVWYQTVWFRWGAVGVASFTLLASLGTGVYAYTSPEVAEDSLLYSVKQKIENIEATTKRTPEAKAQFLLKKIERREAEKAAAEYRGQPIDNIDKKIERAEEQLEKTDRILEKLEVKNEIKNKELRPKIQDRLEKREQKIKDKIEKINNKKLIN